MSKKTYTALIVPAGSGMAVGAISSLRGGRVRVVCVDSSKLAAGLYLGEKGFVVPRFDDPAFYDEIAGIISKEGVDVVIPALDTILLEFSRRKAWFESLGVKVLVSCPSTIEITRDKWLTYDKLRDCVPMPKSFIAKGDIDVEYPFIIKPRGGSGSLDVYKAESEEELSFYFKRCPNPVIQEYLSGVEYTVDCLCDLEGNLLFNVVRQRLETKAGICTKGVVVEEPRLDRIAETIAENIRFVGPFFFQARGDGAGSPRVMEVNPRISGTMSLSSRAGTNLHELAVLCAMGENVEKPVVKKGVILSRYWNEIYLQDCEGGCRRV